MNYYKKTLLLIAVSILLKLLVASTIELSNDEVYYWTFASKLQWNYFDHPPMVAWLIRLTTGDLLFHNELAVRLGAILSSAICTWLFFRIGTLANSLKAGWYAALLYTCSPYCSLIAGTFVLPDGPQMVFWLASVLLLFKISRTRPEDSNAKLCWCLFGITSGLCIMSKVHGVFLWLGLGLYVVFIERRWLKSGSIYSAALITLIIISPIIIWNIQNNYISYTFHSSRVSLMGTEVHMSNILKALWSQVLITNPINFFLILGSLIPAWKGRLRAQRHDIYILSFCSLPLVAAILFISFFRETLAHWPGPAYSCLLILPAISLASKSRTKRDIPNIIKVALAYVFIMAFAQVVVTNSYPGTISEEKQGLKMGTDDPTLDMYGWDEVGRRFDSLYKSDVFRKIMPYMAPIVVDNWFPAAHIDFYVADKTKQQTIGIGSILQLHQYYWMNKYKKPLKNGDSAYLIVPSNLFEYKSFTQLTKRFREFEMALSMDQVRNGMVCRRIYFFRLRGFKK